MVASRQVEIPFYSGIGRQRGRGFGGLAQVSGRTAIPFPRKYIFSAAKPVGADLLEFAVPEIAEVVSGKRISRQLQKAWEEKLWKNRWVVVARKRLRVEFFQQNLQNKSFGREDTFSQSFLNNHV